MIKKVLILLIICLAIPLLFSGCWQADPVTDDIYFQNLYVWDSVGLVWTKLPSAGGAGDMTKAVYDPDLDGIINHHDTGGLGDDDHTQYLLVNGTRSMTGDFDTGGNDIVATGANPLYFKPNGEADDYLTLSSVSDTITLTATGAPFDFQSNGSMTFKPSNDTDDYFTFATVSNIPTIYGTGSYLRIGDANTASHTLASEDDLMVSGKLEVDGVLYADSYFVSGTLYTDSGYSYITSSGLQFAANGQSANVQSKLIASETDSNATALELRLSAGSATMIPLLILTDATNAKNWGLFDGITQPLLVTMDKAEQLHSMTDGIANAGGATAILNHTGGFTNSVVGDIVRITAGTNCTAGWYWITTKTSNDQVTLDRNYTSADTTNVTCVVYHSFPMIGADGVCLKTFDGAPSDSNTEIDRDGWLQLDVSQANGRLYWRANNAWHYVDATAGISLPADERVDLNGHEFQIGDTVIFKVDKINEDGSFHALPYYSPN